MAGSLRLSAALKSFTTPRVSFSTGGTGWTRTRKRRAFCTASTCFCWCTSAALSIGPRIPKRRSARALFTAATWRPPRAAARKTRLKTAKTKGDKAKSKGRTHGKERNASARPSARASHATGSNAAGTDNGLTKGVEARVAAWAVGKDLPSMLGSLGSFSRDFASALPQTAASELRQKPPQVLRRAYHKACLALHPDRHVGSSPESQALALALFQTLSSAFISSANHDDNLSA